MEGEFEERIANGAHGLLAEPGNVEALAQAFARVLSDGKLHRQIVNAVEKLAGVEHFWNYIAERTVCLYQKVLEAKAP